jgi:hypothetical protein
MIINIEHINKTIFPPNPTLDKILVTLLSGIFEVLMYPIPNAQ